MLWALWISFLSLFSFGSSDLSASLVPQNQEALTIESSQELDIDSEHKEEPKKIPTKGVSRAESYKEMLQEVDRLIEHGYYPEAGILLSEITHKYPNQFEPFVLLADIFIRRQDFTALDSLIARMNTLFPDHSGVRILEGRRLLYSDFARFQGFVQQQKLSTLPPRLHVYSALLFSLQNNHTQAQSILEALLTYPIQDFPKTSEEYASTISTDLKNIVQSLLLQYSEFNALSEGKTAHLFALLGKIAGNMDETLLMRSFADLSLKEDISYIDAWILRGYGFFLEEKYALALSDFHEAYRLDPVRPQTAYFLALALMELDKNAEAIVLFEKALEYGFPFSEDVDWKLMDLFLREQKFDLLVPLYMEHVNADLAPQKITAAFHVLIDKIDRSDVAILLGERLIQSEPENIFFLNMMAWSFIGANDFDSAKQTLEKAEDLGPRNPQTYLNWGLLFEAQGQNEKAIEAYKQSYEYGKENPHFTSLANFAARQYNKLIESH